MRYRVVGMCLAIWLELSACKKSFKREVVTEQNIEQIAQRIGSAEGVTPDEARLFAAYIVRHKLAQVFVAGQPNPAPLPATVQEAIDRQRVFAASLAEQDRQNQVRAQAEQQRRAAEAQALRAAVGVSLISLSFQEADPMAGRFDSMFTFNVTTTNLSSRPIRGARGDLRFVDTFNREIGTVTLSIEENIAPGQSTPGTYSKRYNQFIDADRALRNFDPTRHRAEWVPEQVVFADGTQLSVTPSSADTAH